MRRVHVVPHTHWDREWYATYQDFRMRLVRMVDRLLDLLAAEPDYRCFLWDAQTVVVEDYLEIRPERGERLRAEIAAGRIEIGPWYVQPDESLIAGESFIRNFLAGRRIAAEQGTPGLRVGYLPDMFGHISQMPQVLLGFGIETAVLWRGVSGGTPEWIWRSPDGSEVLVLHLPDRTGYSMVHQLARDPEAALREIADLDDPASQSELRLLLVGSDHVEPQRGLPDLLARVRQLPGAPAELVQSGLGELMERLREDLRARGARLEVHVGELRDVNRSPAGRFNFLLPNVLSSRMPLKLRNAEVERELITWAEPLAALARLQGAPTSQPFVRRAWRHLMQNHAHDSIGGCSSDETHRAMAGRFDAALEIARQVTAESAARLAARIDTAGCPEGRLLLLVNPVATDACRALDLVVDLPAGSWSELEVTGGDGSVLPSQVVSRREVTRARSMPETELFPVVVADSAAAPGPDSGWFTSCERCEEVRLRVAAEVPGLGYATCSVRGVARGRGPGGSLRTGPLAADNGLVGLAVTPGGRVSLRRCGRLWEDVLRIEDGGEAGDGYTHAPPHEDEVLVWRPASVGLAEDGPVAVRILLAGDFALPAGLEPSRRRRAADRVGCPLRVELTLARDCPWVDVAVTFTNLARDHRLRLVVPTGIASALSRAQMQWDVAVRPTAAEQPPRTVWIEDAPACHPTHGFVDVPGEAGGDGFAVVGLGLPEYELSPGGELAFTLLRAFGYLSAPALPTRGGAAGPSLATPEAQLVDETVELRLALLPHGEDGDLWDLARAWQNPCRAFPQSRHPGSQPAMGRWLELPPGLDVSALKEGEDGESVILRLFNPGDAVRAGVVGLTHRRACSEVRLDETPAAGGPAMGPDGDIVRVPGKRLHSLRWSVER